MSIGFSWKWTIILLFVVAGFSIFYPSIQGVFTQEGQTSGKIPVLDIEYGKDASEIEQEIFSLINNERAKHSGIGMSLPELTWSNQLYNLAKKHSESMAATGSFEHSDYNLSENIFWAEGYDSDQIGQICFEEWMQSPGHQANLLNKDIRLCGLAILRDNIEWYVTFMAR